jgi:class 3 adenylate cyclase/tetratricopeptide (TPR) repeat protein
VRCAACGVENQPDARFCSACGTRLDGAQPGRETRKTVTIVFCDLVRSTELGEQLDPEALRRVMTRYFDAMRTVLESHGGTVEKFIGDAVMAVFGVPQLHEDDALRAVRAAQEMLHALELLNQQLAADLGVTISARIGINTGPVVAGRGGPDSATLVTGDTVNTAARLEQAAQPGTILLGQPTYRLVRDAVTVEPVGDLALKGKRETLAAVRLVSVVPLAEAQGRRLDSPMVGRQSERDLLTQSYERAVAQRTCQLFTLLGTAGVGKSRLVAEFLDLVTPAAAVLRGRCLPYGEGITYWPIAEAVRVAAGIGSDDARSDAGARLRELIGGPDAERVIPLISELIGLETGGSAQEDLFWAVRTLLETLAADRPLVAVVDDIHWAEPTLLDLIDYIADWSRDSPILLLCSARPELLDGRPGWGGGKLNAASLLLEPLDPAASQELIGHLVGGSGLPAGVGDRISQAAEGNPLFVEEMVGMLVDEGRLQRRHDRFELVGDARDLAVPPTIEALLSARLERLTVAERSVAERGAVVGRVFELPAVVELSRTTDLDGNGDAEIRAAAAAAAVRTDLLTLVRKELIRPERSGASREESFRFRHQLIRDAAYGGLPKEERAALHERFATWLERRAGERLAEYEEIVGYHLEQSLGYLREVGLGRSNDRQLADRAARHLISAGRKAVARSDPRGTLNLLSRARELLASTDPERVMIALELAQALGDAGTDEQIERVLNDAAVEAAAFGDERIEAHLTVMGRLLVGRLVEGRWRIGSSDLAWADETEPLARQAIALFAAAGDEQGLARAWRLLGHLGWARGRILDEERAVEEALRHARAAGDAREEAELLFILTRDLVQGPTPVGDAIARCEQLLAEFPGDRTIEGYMFHALGHLRARLGDFDAAREFVRRYRSMQWESGQVMAYWFSAEVAADVEMIAGEWQQAIAALVEARDNLAAAGSTQMLLLALLVRAYAAAGKTDDAEQAARDPLAAAQWAARGLAAAAVARIRAGQGRLDEALPLIEDATQSFGRAEFVSWHADVLVDRAEVMRLAGRLDQSAAAARQALELYELKGDVVSAARLREQNLPEPPVGEETSEKRPGH